MKFINRVKAYVGVVLITGTMLYSSVQAGLVFIGTVLIVASLLGNDE